MAVVRTPAAERADHSARPVAFVEPAKNLQHVHLGMTIRETYALAAMQGLIAQGWLVTGESYQREIAEIAFAMADAMVKQGAVTT